MTKQDRNPNAHDPQPGASDQPLLSGIVPHLAELQQSNDVAVYLDELRTAIAALPPVSHPARTGAQRFDPAWAPVESGA